MIIKIDRDEILDRIKEIILLSKDNEVLYEKLQLLVDIIVTSPTDSNYAKSKSLLR